MKILIIGEDNRYFPLREKLQKNPNLEIERSDGDEDEDFEEYDVIFDLHFDDEPSNFEIYTGLKNKYIFLNTVKTSINEVVYSHDVKIKSFLFGINALPTFIEQAVWEMVLYRKFEMPQLEKIAKELGVDFEVIEDRVGMVKPKVLFMIINEACFTLQEGTATIEDIDTSMKLGTNYPFGPFEWCDKIGITNVFETLAAVYEDTKDKRYKICPLLKTKYLRNETFYKTVK